ncbi:MAG: substrate-binding domain-containing protein [Dehalococcoidia bacterium]|nr:substrate-binding domain-containing protein [Dehalococcoidia bacterium]
MNGKWMLFGLLVALVLSITALECGENGDDGSGSSPQGTSSSAREGAKDIIVATTTSTQDSGLLDVLVPAFEEETRYNVKVIAVGTGQALAMGERGDADVLLVHAPASEKMLVDSGAGINRRLVMHNDFIILGPESDPAGIKGTTSTVEAFEKIYEAGSTFLNRGDDSGTDKLERSLWKKAGLDPSGASWYEESGQGMGATLQIANQRDAYILCDRATYFAQRGSLSLVILLEGDPALLNVYSVIQVNPDKFDLVNGPGGEAFADFVVSDKAQQIIADFVDEVSGEPLFIPDADKTYEDLGLSTPFG